MNTLNKILVGGLVVQTALVAVMRWPSGGPAEARDLVPFGGADLAVIRITGRKAADEVPLPPVELRREGDGWVITTEEGYPVDPELLQPTLDLFDKLAVREPMATSVASHANLEVADDAFTRMLELESTGGDKVTLFVGAGTGKSAHVRVQGEEEVFSVLGFNAWSLSENANRYFDREVLNVPVSEAHSVTLTRPGAPTLSFAKAEDGTWTATGLVESGVPADLALDQAATTAWLSRLLKLQMQDPAGRQERPEMGLDDATATIVTWTHGDPPETTSYRIGAVVPPERSGRRFARFDGLPYVLEVVESGLKHVFEPDLKALVGLQDVPARPTSPLLGAPGGMPHGGGGGGGMPHGGGGGGMPHGGGGGMPPAGGGGGHP